MNPYIQNLNRIEFVITWACTGRCKHCSEGSHAPDSEYIDGDSAVRFVREICEAYPIESCMTFGGEPLLHPDEVCRIHIMAREMGIPKRQIITNGFFSRAEDQIKETVAKLAAGGVNNVALSVDAFHQETIPIEPVKAFAGAVKEAGIPLCAHPAWLVNREAENPYNEKTHEILREFEAMGIPVSDGNEIFPEGNALKYLGEYFDSPGESVNPYTEDARDIRALCVSPDGSVLGGNICREGIMDIIARYDGTLVP